MGMTIFDAIAIVEEFRDEGEVDLPLDVDPALTLLIEAGKRIDRQRKLAIPIHQPPLPGESIV